MGLFKELVPLLCSLQLQFLRTFSNVEERVNLAAYHMFIRVTPFNIKKIYFKDLMSLPGFKPIAFSLALREPKELTFRRGFASLN